MQAVIFQRITLLVYIFYFNTKNGRIQVIRKIFYITNAVFFTLGVMVLATGAMAILTEEDYLVVFGVGVVAGFISSVFWCCGYENLKRKMKQESVHRKAGII